MGLPVAWIFHRFQEQLKSQTPEQVKLVKEQMDKEKVELQEKYTKEVEDLKKRLEESQFEQADLRIQIGTDFESLLRVFN